MRVKPQWLLVAIVAVFLCWIGWRTQAQNSAKDSWEYKAVPIGNSTLGYPTSVDINELGAQGWELVTSGSVEERVGSSFKQKDFLYFKRKR